MLTSSYPVQMQTPNIFAHSSYTHSHLGKISACTDVVSLAETYQRMYPHLAFEPVLSLRVGGPAKDADRVREAASALSFEFQRTHSIGSYIPFEAIA